MKPSEITCGPEALKALGWDEDEPTVEQGKALSRERRAQELREAELWEEAESKGSKP